MGVEILLHSLYANVVNMYLFLMGFFKKHHENDETEVILLELWAKVSLCIVSDVNVLYCAHLPGDRR